MLVLRIAIVIIVLLCGKAIAGARESRSVFSGPQSGERLPPLKVVLAYGDEAGRTIDLVERAAGKPTLLVIVNGSNRPAARLTRILANFAEMHADKLFAGVAYLASDQTADVQLRELICDALAAEDTPTARSAVAAIEKFVGDNEHRQAALGHAAAILLNRKGARCGRRRSTDRRPIAEVAQTVRSSGRFTTIASLL